MTSPTSKAGDILRERASRAVYDFLAERFPDGALPGGVQIFADPGDHIDADMKHEAGCEALASAVLASIGPWEEEAEGGEREKLVAKSLDWRKPTKHDRDQGGRDSALWIAPGFGGEYAIQSDLKNFILWRVEDPYAFDTFPTVEAAKAHAEADWQTTISRKLEDLHHSSLPSGWRSMDSAPTDGETVDLWFSPVDEAGYVLTPCRQPDAWYECGDWWCWPAGLVGPILINRVSHWMRLTAAPSADPAPADEGVKSFDDYGPDPHYTRESSEDHRLLSAGYKVCGSAANTQWHWQEPGGTWHDGHRSELTASRAALRHLRQALASMEGGS